MVEKNDLIPFNAVKNKLLIAPHIFEKTPIKPVNKELAIFKSRPNNNN